jgi:hypothetical protein
VTGCFDIEQTLTLERNMSGKAGFSMKVDMEPMVAFMAQMQREMGGKKGPATAAEIEAAKQDMLKNGKKETTGDFAKDKKEMQAQLPKGITLLDAQMKDEGLKMGVSMLFGFDNASKLALMQPTSFLVNTARGAVVDQLALEDALAAGRLAGAGLDVLDPEPPPADARILGFSNVILAPHALCWTDQCFAAIGAGCIEPMQALARGAPPRNVVNASVLAAPSFLAKLTRWRR